MFEQWYNVENNVWDSSTMTLYVFMIAFSYILGWLAQTSKVLVISTSRGVLRPKSHINYFWLLAIFMFLFIILAFRDVGKDLPVYKDLFYYSNTRYVKNFGNEPGFVLLNRIIRAFTSKESLGIATLSLISVLFVFKTIQRYADNIDLSVALLAFTSMFYFNSFNLLRIYLVSYFLCYTFHYMVDGKLMKYSLCVVIGTYFHYSAILMIIPVVYYYLYTTNRKIFWIGIIGFIIAFFVSLQYLTILNIFDRYASYMENSDGGNWGFAQIVYYIPLLSLYLYMKQRRYLSIVLDLFFIFSLFSFFFGMMGYKIMMIGRVEAYFIVVFVLLLPNLIKTLKQKRDKYYLSIKICSIIYILFRAHMFFKEYLYSSDIMPYKFIESL